MSLACVAFFSSCAKDEVTAKIKMDGTVRFVVRGYSIGSTGDDYYPKNVTRNIYGPVQGYKMTLKNGKSITTDKDGIATITLETGEYLIDKIELPSGYYYDYTKNYDNVTNKYKYEFVEPDDDRVPDYGYFYVSGGYEDRVIELYTR